MKKILLLFALTITFSVLTQAQVSRVMSFKLNDTITRTIIKENSSQHPASISYVETASEHLFVYNDGHNLVTTVPIDINYSVNDFVVNGSRVFFCGVTTGNLGFFGEFEWYDFFFVNEHYRVSNAAIITQSNSTVRTLDKLVSYNTNSGIEVVGLGKNSSGYSCVVEWKYSPSLWEYYVGEFGPNSYDILTDISQTDDYVIAVGYRAYGANFISVRAFDKNNVFSTPGGIQDESFGFYYVDLNNGISCRFDSTQILVSPIGGNMFFVSSFFKKYESNALKYGTFLGYFQAVSTPSFGISRNNSFFIEQPLNNGGWKLRGVTQPMAINQNVPFYLLENAEITNMQTNVDMVFDLTYFNLNSSSGASVHYYIHEQYRSIDGYQNNTRFIMNGWNLLDKTHLMFCEGGMGNYGCSHSTFFPSEKESFIGERFFTDPFSVNGLTQLSFEEKTGGIVSVIHGYLDCQNKGADYYLEEER